MKRYKSSPQPATKSYIGTTGRIVHETCYGSQEGRVAKLRTKGVGLLANQELLNSCDCYLCPVIQNGKIGFINSFAEVVIPPKYDRFIGEFNEVESVIVVFRDNMCGVLNTDGLEMLMGEYKSISLVGNQYAIVMNSEYRRGIIEIMTNRITIPFGEYDNFNYYNGLLIACKKLLKGLISPTGKQITPIRYRWISGVEYGLLRIIIEEKIDDAIIKKWGLLDLQGNEILPAIYDNISRINNNAGVVYAEKDGRTIKFNVSNITQREGIVSNKSRI